MYKIANFKRKPGEKYRVKMSESAAEFMKVYNNVVAVTDAIASFLNENNVAPAYHSSLTFTADVLDDSRLNLEFPTIEPHMIVTPAFALVSPTASPASKKLILSPSASHASRALKYPDTVETLHTNFKRALEVCASGATESPSQFRESSDEKLEEIKCSIGPLVKIRSNKALVQNQFPSDVTPTDLEEVINGAAWDYGILLEPDKAVIEVSYVEHECLSGFQIEFLNEFIARRLCDIKDLLFHDQYLIMAQEQSLVEEQAVEVPSKFVTVTNLPKFFLKSHFSDFVTETAWLLNVCEEEEQVVKDVKHEEGTTTCRIEFVDAKYAETIVMKGLFYDNNKLVLVQEKECAQSTPIFKISNLPRFFHEAHFQNYMQEREKLMQERELQGVDSTVTADAVQIKEYCKTERTCIVEFRNIKFANKICNEEVIYDRQKLIMERQMQAEHSIQATTMLKCSHLPRFFHQAHFENFLSEIGRLYDLDNIIREINKYNSGERSCVVEFASSKIALQFLGFKPLVYSNVILSLECLPTPHDEKDSDRKPTELIESSVDANDDGEDNNIDSSLDTPKKADSLKGVSETEVFLGLCKERIDPKTKKFVANTKNFEEISDELRSVHNIKVYGVHCRDRFRGLSRNYLAEKKKGNSMWIHFNDMAYLRREGKTPPRKQPPMSKSKVMQYKPAKAPTQRKNNNTVGNNEVVHWTEDAVTTLISLRVELDPKFDSNAHRNSTLWALISTKLDNKYTPDQCKDKMDRLMDKYKNYRETRKATGNNTQPFNHEQELSELMGNWVNVEPEITFSFGCVSAVEGRQASHPTESTDEDE